MVDGKIFARNFPTENFLDKKVTIYRKKYGEKTTAGNFPDEKIITEKIPDKFFQVTLEQRRRKNSRREFSRW